MRVARHLLLLDNRPPPPATLLRDTFARADSATDLGTCDTGQTWAALTGTFGVVSNSGYRVGITTVDSVASINVGAAWATYECSVFATDEFPGIAFDITDANNFYAVLINNGLQRLELYKRVGGTYTLIANSANSLFGTFTDVPLRVVRSGASKAIQISGVPVISVSDTSLSVTNSVGFRFQTNNGTNQTRWKNITVMGA